MTNEYILGSLEVTKDVIWNGVTPDGTLLRSVSPVLRIRVVTVRARPAAS
ncbi:hypothetical protein [Methanovulcanius yangii]|nr:hypothetical protein [Methanovulcanius yangii]